MQEELKKIIEEKKGHIDAIKKNMAEIIVGQEKLIDRLLVAMLTRSHILLESVPGLAKTTAISALAKSVDLGFKRIQFTPDILPSDLIGSRIFNMHENAFYVKKGPIFSNLILADEINRSPAKVQSALLEAMQERQVTIGEDTFKLDDPFLVMATENPIEQEGTYPLPEAQVDRFLLKTTIDYPSKEEEMKIIEGVEKRENRLKTISPVIDKKDLLVLIDATEKIHVDKSIKEYIIDLVFATRFPEKREGAENDMAKLIAYGGSPRASIGLLKASRAIALLRGRSFVVPEDIKEIALDVLRHRIMPSYEAEAENIKSDDLVRDILNTVKVP
jgi:MoxR-like ATPase